MTWRFSWALATVLAVACGGATAAERPPPAHGDHAHGHHAHGHHHDSPEALRPLMRDLYGWMGDLDAALEAEDVDGAAAVAATIARACDDQDLTAPDPEAFGPRFLEHDRALHGAADRLATQAAAGDLEAARATYAEVHAACVACHAQAPTASRVDLGPLAP